MSRLPRLALIIALLAPASANNSAWQAEGDQRGDAAVRRLLDDYIGLYRRDTLDRWRMLFVPGFTATYTNDEGGVTTRNLNEFYERQRAAFAAGEVSETLHNVRIHRDGQLAQVSADFRFTARGTTRPGKLMLLMIVDKGELRIAALAFTYHLR